MKLLLGDCLEQLRSIPDNSIDSVVTDPPYGISFMGKKWDYEVPSVEVWKECLRVLKPGGHMLVACGTRTQHRMAINIEDAGFEIRDVVTWLYGSGFPKSHNIKEGDFKGWGTALKPACEFWTLARKPLIGTVAENVQEHGTGTINIEGCRVEVSEEDQAVLDAAVRRMTGNTTRHTEDRQFLHGTKTIQPKSAQGRWPANLILDEVAAEMLDEQSGISKPQKVRVINRAAHNGFGGDAFKISEGKTLVPGDEGGGASRFFYVAKASKSERNEGLDEFPDVNASVGDERPSGQSMQRLDGRAASFTKNHHPTVKPIKLMRYLARLITPPGGTVLDPFMGSGSTGVAALIEGFSFTGIERDSNYFEIAKARIGNQQAIQVIDDMGENT